jgi:ankyrin repeat protein
MNKKEEKKLANNISQMMFKDNNLSKQVNTAEILNILDSLENIDLRDSDERTPLINAACYNQQSILENLIKRGADINLQDKIGCTALHASAKNGFIEIAKILLSFGAKVDLIDKYGNTPLSDAVFYSNGTGELIKLLLSYGADKNLKNFSGVSPLELANNIGNYNISQFFN